jgi:hypothetical protein
MAVAFVVLEGEAGRKPWLRSASSRSCRSGGETVLRSNRETDKKKSLG